MGGRHRVCRVWLFLAADALSAEGTTICLPTAYAVGYYLVAPFGGCHELRLRPPSGQDAFLLDIPTA